MVRVSAWALAVSMAVVGACAAEPTTRVRVGTEAVVATVDERFLSFAVDAVQVVGGLFWNLDGAPGSDGTRQVAPFDFGRPALRALTAELAPALLRIGGTDADRVFYDLGATPLAAPPANFRYTLTAAQWSGAMELARALDLEVLFTLNAGPGPRQPDGDRALLLDNAQALVAHARRRGDPIAAWELGNEVNAYALFHDLPLGVDGYVRDLRAARAMLDATWPGAKLAASASAYWPLVGEVVSPLLPPTVAQAGGLLDVITWHYYPQQSRRCPAAVRRAGPEVLLDPRALDEIAEWAGEVEAARDVGAPGRPVWLGESGNAQCGGEPGVSDRFAGTLWWIDQLGLIARRGQAIVVRQSLTDVNYGLLDEETLEPRPDYWASVLWKRLVDRRVLDVASPSPTVRAYAACLKGRPGGAVAIVVHLARDREEPRLAVDGLGGAAEVYTLTAPALDSAAIALDGRPLLLADRSSGALPPLAPRRAVDGRFALPPLSVTFAAFPDAALAICR